MNYLLEFDFSKSWITTILKGLREVGERIQQKADDEEMPDGLEMLEHCEELFGVVCVVSQTYMSRTWSQILRANKRLNPSEKKWEAIPMFGRKIKDLEITNVELVYHLGNYWKHSDEWENWNPTKNDSSFYTINVLSSIGISEQTEFPCVYGFNELDWFKNPLFDELEVELFEWRDKTALYHLAEGGR